MYVTLQDALYVTRHVTVHVTLYVTVHVTLQVTFNVTLHLTSRMTLFEDNIIYNMLTLCCVTCCIQMLWNSFHITIPCLNSHDETNIAIIHFM